MLDFVYPWVFLLLPLPLLVRRWAPAYREARAAVRLPFFGRLAGVLGVSPSAGAASRRRSRIEATLFIATWFAVVAALARPQWLEPPIVRELPTRDLLLAVDLSGSMETADFAGADGVVRDRLTAVKEVLDEFLARRAGDRVGLVVFGNAAFVQSPFTTDLDVVRQLLDEMVPRMAGPRTAFGDAIGLGITLFERSELAQRVMIALTDGNDTGSLVAPAEAARIARDKGIVVHTVAIGDPGSAGEEALDEVALKQVAATTGGEYFFAADQDSLEGIYRALDALDTRKIETVSYRPRRELLQWPLAGAFLIALGWHVVAGLVAWRRRGDRRVAAEASP